MILCFHAAERSFKMEKFIPYEKLSKKKQRELDAQRRGSWNGISPVTRKAKNPKAYDRRKARKWSDAFHDRAFLRSPISAHIFHSPGNPVCEVILWQIVRKSRANRASSPRKRKSLFQRSIPLLTTIWPGITLKTILQRQIFRICEKRGAENG